MAELWGRGESASGSAECSRIELHLPAAVALLPQLGIHRIGDVREVHGETRPAFRRISLPGFARDRDCVASAAPQTWVGLSA